MMSEWISVEDRLPEVNKIHIGGEFVYCESNHLVLKVEGFNGFNTGYYHMSKDGSYKTWRVDWCHGDFEVLAWYDVPEFVAEVK